MRFFDVVLEVDRGRIERAVDDILRFGDSLHRKVAGFIQSTGMNIYVGPKTIVRGSGSVQFCDPKSAHDAVFKGVLKMSDAAEHVQLNIARETIDTGGQQGIEGTLVHEGKHAMDFARLLSSASLGNPKQFFNPTALQKEYSAHLTAAFYLRLRDGEYSEEGLRLGLLKRDKGSLRVDPQGIKNRLRKNYGLTPESPGARLDTATDPPVTPSPGRDV